MGTVGKSAHIVLDDVNLAKTLPKSVRSGVLMNSGQTCSAQTRMLVSPPLFPAFPPAFFPLIRLGPALRG